MGVSVTSKCNDDPVQHVWESTADASFTVVDDPRGNTLGRGTRVTLHLKEDAHDYLSEDKLKESAKKYSQFIQFPIYVKVKKEVDADAEEDDDDDKDDEEEKKDDVETKEDDEKEEEEEEKKAPKKKTVFEWEQMGTQKAIWLRAKEDVTEEEYNEFYKAISKDYLDPLAYTHFNAEGEIEFKSILFLPKKAPFDMMDNYWTKRSEVKLYVRRVLVAEKFDELLPRYLGFVRGVVDSDDLPLNVSREQLQQNKIMKVISKKLVRKVLELMKKTLEINANHPVVIDLLSKIKTDKENEAALDTAQVLFQTALIESGYEIADPSALVSRVYRLMSKELNVDPDAPIKEVEVPEEEEEAEEEEKEGEGEGDDADETEKADDKEKEEL